MTKTNRVAVTLALGSFVALTLVAAMVSSERIRQTLQLKSGLDENGVKLAQTLFLEDQRAAILGEESAVPKETAMTNMGISQIVDARKLSQDYDANEVAADQHYKGGRLLVIGTVSDVSKDFIGNPYVTLTGHQFLQDVQARFGVRAENTLATLKRGQSVNVVCEVGEKIVTEVVLKNCMMFDDYVDTVRPQFNKYVVEVLAGKQQVSKASANVIAFSYMTARLLPHDSSCFQRADEACEAQLSAVLKKADKSTAQSLNKDSVALAATLNVK